QFLAIFSYTEIRRVPCLRQELRPLWLRCSSRTTRRLKACSRSSSSPKAESTKTAIQELEVHAQLEEKLIYPAIRAEIDEDEKMNEAVEEHHVVHVLIGELKKLKPSDERFQAKFSVLSELVKHHIEEEEGEI